MNLWEMYMQVNQLWIELDMQLHGQHMCDVDDPKVTARDDLSLWLAEYRCECATYLDGFLFCQNALDALNNEVTR